MISLILKPIDYLKIRLSDGSKQKQRLEITYPFILAIIISLILLSLFILKNEVSIFSEKNNFLPALISFFQSMPGFYIAALAAIATFPSESMSKRMPEPTPYNLIDTSSDDISSNRDYLSRRRFLCFMFSYLAFMSIVFLLVGISLNFLFSFSIYPIPSWGLYFGYFLSCLLILFIAIQIIFITFLSLWYLGHRIHLNDIS